MEPHAAGHHNGGVSTPADSESAQPASRFWDWSWRLAIGLTLALVLPPEFRRIQALAQSGDPQLVLFHWNIDSTPYFFLLVSCPLAFWWGRRSRSQGRPAVSVSTNAWQAPVLAGILGLLASVALGLVFGNRPPAFHDEYSYLLQAETFLAGKTSFPSAAEPRLFDQMHVLNEGRFASRYLPGTGLWLAPFVAAGNPWAGQWLANGLCAGLAALIARKIATRRAALIAGVLTAVSPGMVLFSNLLLAHHPTLLGLLLFAWAFLSLRRSGHPGWGGLAGLGLTFAMLCRPMTAAGVGLPFGLWLAWSILAGRAGVTRLRSLTHAAAVGAPVVIGLVALGWYNRELTGSPWLSPYQQFTDVYTPRHVFGFNNGVRGDLAQGPRVMKSYDRWAENLTPALAIKNVGARSIASVQWTLGLVPLAMIGTLLLPFFGAPREGSAAQGTPADRVPAALILAAIGSLHAVHVPYWFVGIMNWHYVFETGPLWLILTGVVADAALQRCQELRSRAGKVWGATLLGVALLMNLTSLEPVWTGRLWLGAGEVLFARNTYSRFQGELERVVRQRPAIVLIVPDPADRHLDLVTNSPDLSGEVLRARSLPEVSLSKVRDLYPERSVYEYDVCRNQWRFLAAPRTPGR